MDDDEIETLRKIERVYRRSAYLDKIKSNTPAIPEQPKKPRVKYSLVGDPCVCERDFLGRLARERKRAHSQTIPESEAKKFQPIQDDSNSPVCKKSKTEEKNNTIIYLVMNDTNNFPPCLSRYIENFPKKTIEEPKPFPQPNHPIIKSDEKEYEDNRIISRAKGFCELSRDFLDRISNGFDYVSYCNFPTSNDHKSIDDANVKMKSTEINQKTKLHISKNAMSNFKSDSPPSEREPKNLPQSILSNFDSKSNKETPVIIPQEHELKREIKISEMKHKSNEQTSKIKYQENAAEFDQKIPEFELKEVLKPPRFSTVPESEIVSGKDFQPPHVNTPSEPEFTTKNVVQFPPTFQPEFKHPKVVELSYSHKPSQPEFENVIEVEIPSVLSAVNKNNMEMDNNDFKQPLEMEIDFSDTIEYDNFKMDDNTPMSVPLTSAGETSFRPGSLFPFSTVSSQSQTTPFYSKPSSLISFNQTSFSTSVQTTIDSKPFSFQTNTITPSSVQPITEAGFPSFKLSSTTPVSLQTLTEHKSPFFQNITTTSVSSQAPTVSKFPSFQFPESTLSFQAPVDYKEPAFQINTTKSVSTQTSTQSKFSPFQFPCTTDISVNKSATEVKSPFFQINTSAPTSVNKIIKSNTSYFPIPTSASVPTFSQISTETQFPFPQTTASTLSTWPTITTIPIESQPLFRGKQNNLSDINDFSQSQTQFSLDTSISKTALTDLKLEVNSTEQKNMQPGTFLTTSYPNNGSSSNFSGNVLSLLPNMTQGQNLILPAFTSVSSSITIPNAFGSNTPSGPLMIGLSSFPSSMPNHNKFPGFLDKPLSTFSNSSSNPFLLNTDPANLQSSKSTITMPPTNFSTLTQPFQGFQTPVPQTLISYGQLPSTTQPSHGFPMPAQQSLFSNGQFPATTNSTQSFLTTSSSIKPFKTFEMSDQQTPFSFGQFPATAEVAKNFPLVPLPQIHSSTQPINNFPASQMNAGIKNNTFSAFSSQLSGSLFNVPKPTTTESKFNNLNLSEFNTTNTICPSITASQNNTFSNFSNYSTTNIPQASGAQLNFGFNAQQTAQLPNSIPNFNFAAPNVDFTHSPFDLGTNVQPSNISFQNLGRNDSESANPEKAQTRRLIRARRTLRK
ncbi:hypothetical protein MXB_4678 [Myxobolus squamalis]|nr:hypothetical protein MXB_4678 [Myxobolus squamalis]